MIGNYGKATIWETSSIQESLIEMKFKKFGEGEFTTKVTRDKNNFVVEIRNNHLEYSDSDSDDDDEKEEESVGKIVLKLHSKDL